MSQIVWVRTCQECGHKQKMKSPRDKKGDSWRDALCRRCKSPALDFGQEMIELLCGDLVRLADGEDVEDVEEENKQTDREEN